jgi:hypothetical protein
MENLLLTDEEIARALEKRKIFKGKDLSKAIDEGDRFIAQAQLAKASAYHDKVISDALTEWKKEHKDIKTYYEAQSKLAGNPYPPTITDEVSGVEVSNRDYEVWVEARKYYEKKKLD